MPQELSAKDLLKLALDSVYEVQPPDAKIWRDQTYDALIVTGAQHPDPTDEPERYKFLATVEEARVAYEEIAALRRGPALCRKAYYCPNAQLVEEDE